MMELRWDSDKNDCAEIPTYGHQVDTEADREEDDLQGLGRVLSPVKWTLSLQCGSHAPGTAHDKAAATKNEPRWNNLLQKL